MDKMINCLKLFFILCLFSLVTTACESKADQKELEKEITISGVTIHGYNCEGWIKNNNITPIRITKKNMSYGFNYVDYDTIFITELKPKEIIKTHIYSSTRFYIYNTNDTLSGLIDPSIEMSK